MKNILLLVHDDEGQEARLRAVIDLARSIDGHVTCLDGLGLPQEQTIPSTSRSGAMVLEKEREREAPNTVELKARLAGCGISWEWPDGTGSIADDVRSAVKTCDLTVLNCEDLSAAGPATQLLIEEIVVASGLPILAVPVRGCGVRPNGRVLIAWDGRCEAIDRLKTIAPLLQAAFEVHLLEIGHGRGAHAMADLASYLDNYGIASQAFHLEADRPIADMIRDEARSRGVGYIVLGAFQHSRKVDDVFSGVTQSMLDNTDRPLLLTHR